MECFEWYLEMCRDAREGFGRFQEKLSEMFKAGSRADSGHHLSGQVAGVSTMPEAQLSKTAPCKTWKFLSLYSGCGIAHFFKRNLVLIEVKKNASISVCPPLLVTRGTFASASISAVTLTCRDLAQVNLG